MPNFDDKYQCPRSLYLGTEAVSLLAEIVEIDR